MNFRPHVTGRQQTAMEAAWNRAVQRAAAKKKPTPAPQQPKEQRNGNP